MSGHSSDPPKGHIVCGRFLRWIPRAIPNLVASSRAVSELYWGKKALHVCMKIANLGPRLGRSTLRVRHLKIRCGRGADTIRQRTASGCTWADGGAAAARARAVRGRSRVDTGEDGGRRRRRRSVLWARASSARPWLRIDGATARLVRIGSGFATFDVQALCVSARVCGAACGRAHGCGCCHPVWHPDPTSRTVTVADAFASQSPHPRQARVGSCQASAETPRAWVGLPRS
eukprot:COSAG02_NODE_1858_length_10636_cov_6.878333_1_plen_231_part_00